MVDHIFFLEFALTNLIRKKYSVAEDNKVSVEVAKQWTDELYVMLDEMVPGVTKV